MMHGTLVDHVVKLKTNIVLTHALTYITCYTQCCAIDPLCLCGIHVAYLSTSLLVWHLLEPSDWSCIKEFIKKLKHFPKTIFSHFFH